MRAPFAVKALIPAYAAAAAVFALWAAPAQAATHAECARRLAEIRSSNPDVGRAIPGGSGNESLVLRFCLNDIPSEGLDCVFENLGQGGKLSRKPSTAISLCDHRWKAPLSCMRDLFQQGTVDNLLDASDICKATDPEQRRCAIEQMGNPAARQHLTFQIVEACAPAKPEIHECMLAYLHHESPFNFVPAENIGDAHDLCAYWAWAGPESKACLQAYYGRKPPFDVVHPPLQDQALLVCGFKDPSLQRCLLDGIQRSDRAKIVNCLTSPKVSQADKKSCQDYLWTRLHDEWTTNDVCSIANSELRKCAVAKVIEGLPFYQANLVCSWDDVALLMKGAPPCEGASGHSP